MKKLKLLLAYITELEKALPKKKRRKNKKPTQKQLAQQAKFATAVRFVRVLIGVLTPVFSIDSRGVNNYNKALSHVLKGAIAGTYPSYDIAYRKVSISRGLLPHADSATVSASALATIRFDWTNLETAIGKARSTDRVIMVVYCPECNRAVYRKGAQRSVGTDTLSAKGFTNKVVHTWLTFLSEDGKEVADSLYTGELMVVA
jgi:hypothetical protein